MDDFLTKRQEARFFASWGLTWGGVMNNIRPPEEGLAVSPILLNAKSRRFD